MIGDMLMQAPWLMGLVVAINILLIWKLHHATRLIARLDDRWNARWRLHEDHYLKQENYLVERIAELKTENENLRHRVSQRL